MIYIRKADGSRVPLEEGEFMEVCDASDKIAFVFFYSPRFRSIRRIDPNTERAANYSKLFEGAVFNEIKIVDGR